MNVPAFHGVCRERNSVSLTHETRSVRGAASSVRQGPVGPACPRTVRIGASPVTRTEPLR